MKVQSTKQGERGIALVIAIFTLMLITVVGTALILMAGTETAFKANYRTSMQAFYAAKAGLEEGRSRLSATSPTSIASCVFGAPPTPAPYNRVCYIINPAPGEVVNPLDPANPYADTEYALEFGFPLTGASVSPFVNSTSPEANGIAGPMYKWVRITPRTQYSAGINVDGTPANTAPDTQTLYFNGTQQSTDPTSGPQVLTITAFAVTPSSGSSGRRILQSVVTAPPDPSTLSIPSAMTMLGNNPLYQPATSQQFAMKGLDRSASDQSYVGCTLPRQPNVNAIGVTTDNETVKGNIVAQSMDTHYPGTGSSPSVANIYNTLNSTERTVSGMESLVQSLVGGANQVVAGPTTSDAVTSLGSATNPVTVVVQGDFTLNGNVTGYGILVVTGNLIVNGPAGWRGLVLVIGQGNIDGNNANGGSEFDGAIIVAKTRDSSGNLLFNFGPPSIDWTNGGGRGIYYDSCWLKTMVPGIPYTTLSFREKNN